MGTHGGAAITFKSGKHYCEERSMDGHDTLQLLGDWINSGMKVKDFPGVGGANQWGNQREHDHGGLYYHVDFKEKVIHSGISPEDWIIEFQGMDDISGVRLRLEREGLLKHDRLCCHIHPVAEGIPLCGVHYNLFGSIGIKPEKLQQLHKKGWRVEYSFDCPKNSKCHKYDENRACCHRL